MKRIIAAVVAIMLMAVGACAFAEEIFSDGMYLVNTDIQPGLYKVVLTASFTGTGYVERCSGLSMEFDDIIANEMILGDSYLEILDTDTAVQLSGVEITKIDLSSYAGNPQSEYTDGMYLVGYDIMPGTYKVTLNDSVMGMGYVERLSAATCEMDAIISNAIIEGDSYLEIKDGDFAVGLQGVTITPVE